MHHVIVYPAIDIRDGKAVRLVEGDFDQETVFDADPVEAARRWQDAGAEWIHIVDLDGARHGNRPNQATIEHIRAAVTPRLQLGGGMRSLENLASARESGIDRMVIGSAAVSNPELVPAAVEAHGDAIAIGIDARNGMVATQGWTDQTTVSALELAELVASQGVHHIIYTDISRDGRLQGPNLQSLREMLEATTASVIASGGISSLEDIREVAKAGASGVIVGAALYHRRFEISEALELARRP
jgi:phosphoribosylformimino-5-aminoimidazole carboxamide ribotide isomerase